MRLAAPVEAAHPGRRLLGLAQVAEELVEDPLEPALVLALADEAPQLPLERRPVSFVLWVPDLRDAEVRDVADGGIESEDVAVRRDHTDQPFSLLMTVAW